MKSFQLFETTIDFAPPAERYRDGYVRYFDLAENISVEFEVEYEDLDDPEECVETILQWTTDSIQRTAEAAVGDLIGSGIYDVDEETFLQRLKAALEGSAAWQVFTDVIASLPEQPDDEPASGGPFIGGGFGLEGALKGMAVATAANLAVGLISSGLSSARRGAHRRDASALLTNVATVRRLSGAISDLVLMGYDVLVDMLVERGGGVFERPSDDDRKKARAIVRNAGAGRIPDEAIRDALINALRFNPYDPAAYVLLKSKGHWNGELDALAAYINLDASDAAEAIGVAELIGEKAASQVASLESGIKAILAKYPNRDLHLAPNIPPAKFESAFEHYFNMATPPAPDSQTEPPVDPGRMIGLIDATVLGSAKEGIAFGTDALAWRDVSRVAALVPWNEFLNLRGTMRKTLFGVWLAGAELGLSGSKVKRNDLLAILNEIGDLLEHRSTKADQPEIGAPC